MPRQYQYGFANEFATEALPGALPRGQNSPQHAPYGLVSELVSGTSLAAPRAQNRRSYLFRIRPSTGTHAFTPFALDNFQTPPLAIAPYPGALRWGPFPLGEAECDFLDGIETVAANGSPGGHAGMALHIYRATRSMEGRVFSNGDGDMLMLPQQGALSIVTELGVIDVAPGEFALLPKGLKFRVDLTGAEARGFICENYGLPFVLPDLGLIGSHGLANSIDFMTPVAAFEDSDVACTLIHKFAGNFWSADIGYSPFDVVAWRGNWAPCKYDMRNFAVIGALSHDHPDPSIFCALSSPSDAVAGGNVDFMILPPRWVVAEHTFRPPGFHRNAVAEILGLIEGSHDARSSDFAPGSMSLTNNWVAHGPDTRTFEVARTAPLEPRYDNDTLVFMLETRFPLQLTRRAMEAGNRRVNCAQTWAGFTKRFPGG
ncbi:MAG: homogentisate 1,2-dioxygenase [Novosphingobium sp.]|uniref:homogentisate 1,2-dioxygenase n=1 Tax=Novosphingobium sp. TaxID=1874826 RepID=UPI0027358998|nr:homogentisate 1,2-dioxygenase [Novosphingobium sp.]MDP3550786.1 homogentisate 1,2-dioxygenase [Novosphingobium sp.]